MNAQVWIAILAGIAATVNDLAKREIANWIPVALLAAGLGWHIGVHGWTGAWIALAGAAVGFGVFLIFYLLGGMGGGDVKLMAGFGALLGTGRLLEAALWAAGIGGVLAVSVLGWRAVRRGLGRGAAASAGRESIPYAPAITLGVWIALLAK